jgi:hypothetical protein
VPLNTRVRFPNGEARIRNLALRCYFAASSGNVADDVIKKYIELQCAEPQDDDKFRISG